MCFQLRSMVWVEQQGQQGNETLDGGGRKWGFTEVYKEDQIPYTVTK